MAEQFQAAAVVGVRTFRVNGAGALADITLKQLMINAGISTAELEEVKHVDFVVITGPVNSTNDGLSSGTASFQFDAGDSYQIKHSRHLIVEQWHFSAPGAHDIRFMVFK